MHQQSTQTQKHSKTAAGEKNKKKKTRKAYKSPSTCETAEVS